MKKNILFSYLWYISKFHYACFSIILLWLLALESYLIKNLILIEDFHDKICCANKVERNTLTGDDGNRWDTWSDMAHWLNRLLLNGNKEIKETANIKNNKGQVI